MSFLFGSANNGRVNFGTGGAQASIRTSVPGFEYRQTSVDSEATDAIRGNVEATPLNQAYFSPANVQIIQNKIRREVYDRSGGEYLVDPQSVDELLVIMRAMYLQYGKNQPDHIREQIAELNTMVADFAVPKILSECSMHVFYLKDITSLPVPMSHPVKITQKGSKSATFDRYF